MIPSTVVIFILISGEQIVYRSPVRIRSCVSPAFMYIKTHSGYKMNFNLQGMISTYPDMASLGFRKCVNIHHSFQVNIYLPRHISE